MTISACEADGTSAMARANWRYIRVDVLLPEHPKTDHLSDKAFRTLIEIWCWCGLNGTDGFVRDAKWVTFGTRAARAQLLVVPPGCQHGFAERADGGYLMHDYTGPEGHQRSRAEIDELSERRAKAGKQGAASRWGTLASAMALGMTLAMANRWQA